MFPRSHEIDQFIINEIKNVKVDMLQLATELQLTPLPINANIDHLVIQTIVKVFHHHKRRMAPCIYLVPLDDLPGDILQKIFTNINTKLASLWIQEEVSLPKKQLEIHIIEDRNKRLGYKVQSTSDIVMQFERVNGIIENDKNKQENHKQDINKVMTDLFEEPNSNDAKDLNKLPLRLTKNQKLLLQEELRIPAVQPLSNPIRLFLNDNSALAMFIKTIRFNFPPDNYYRPPEFKFRRGRLPVSLQEKGAYKVNDDFTSFKKLTQLSSTQFQVKSLSEKLAQQKSDIYINVKVFDDIFDTQVIGKKQPQLEGRLVEQTKSTLINTREFKEHLYRMMFLRFGTLIERDHQDWLKNQEKYIEFDRDKYHIKRLRKLRRLGKFVNGQFYRQKHYVWYDQMSIVLKKLQQAYLIKRRQEDEYEFKVAFMSLISLTILIESTVVIEKLQQLE